MIHNFEFTFLYNYIKNKKQKHHGYPDPQSLVRFINYKDREVHSHPNCVISKGLVNIHWGVGTGAKNDRTPTFFLPK